MNVSKMNYMIPTATAVAALLAFAGCGQDKAATPATEAKTETTIRVKTAKAASRAFEARLGVQGGVDAKSEANVSARISGNLDSIWVDEGDVVEAGKTPLFQIDPVSLSNEVTIAEQALSVAKSGLAVNEANLKSIEATARKAELDFARYERLHKEGRVTANEFETRETQNLQAKANIEVGKAQIALARQQVEQATARLTIARKNLEDAHIVAPLTGRISLRAADPGEFIAAGKPILKIVDPDKLEATGFVPAAYYGQIIQGKTTFRLSDGKRDLGPVTVTYKSPVVDTTLRTFEVKGLLSKEQAASLAPGMMIGMQLVFETRESLGVPAGAVLIRDGKNVVFVAENGKAVQHEVKTGFANDGLVEILEGLEADDEVIYEGHTLVREGLPIEIAQ